MPLSDGNIRTQVNSFHPAATGTVRKNFVEDEYAGLGLHAFLNQLQNVFCFPGFQSNESGLNNF
jgi:hypothetical protein